MTVAYHRKPVLWDIDLAVPEGKLVGIVGPNGAGKTTLIKAVLGLVPLASGKVEIYGKPYNEQRHLIGYVPQRESVDWDFPVTVRDVVLMGTYGRLGWFRRPGRAEREVADRCLDQVGMSDFAQPADPPTLRRPAAARVPRPRAGPGGPRLLHGRAVRRRRCRDRSRDHRPAAEAPLRRQNGVRRPSRFANGPQLFRLRDPAQHAARRLRADRTTFTTENLHETYGGRLTILDEAAEAVRNREPIR